MTDDFTRIKDNVQRLIDLKVPPSEIEGYLKTEGLDSNSFKQKMLTPKPDVYSSDPGFWQRLNDRAGESLQGTAAKQLPEGVGIGTKAADVVANIQDLIAGSGATAARGFTWGLSDDAAALGTATGKAAKGQGAFSDNYKTADARENKIADDFKAAHPYIGYPLEISTGLASPLSSLGGKYIAGGSSMLDRAVRSIPIGSAAGLVTGLGYSEGSLKNRLQSGGMSAGLGAILAPVATAGTEMLVGAGQKGLDALKNFSTAKQNPDLQAQRLVAQALSRDNVNQPALMQTAGATPETQDMGLVDLAGPNMTALGRQATAAPGEGRATAQDFFQGRRVDAPSRTIETLQSMIPQNADDEILRLGTEKMTAAKPLYKLSDAADPETLNTPFVKQILASPEGKQALSEAQDLWRKDFLAGKVDGPDPFTPVLDAEGNLTLDKAPSMKLLDYMKRGMDKMTDAAYGSSKTAGNAMRDLRNAFRDHLKEINPAYAKALASWSGPSHTQDLMDEGIGFLGGGRVPPKLQRIASLEGPDLEAYRIGAVTGMIDRLNNVTEAGSVYDALANSPNKKKLLDALFPDKADFNKLMTRLLAERTMINTERQVMGNSVTSRLDAEKADASSSIGWLKNLADVAQGNVISPALNMLTRLSNPARGIDEKTAASLAKLIFDSTPAARQAGLLSVMGPGNNLVTQSAHQQALQAATRGLLGGRAGVGAGLLTGGSIGSVR